MSIWKRRYAGQLVRRGRPPQRDEVRAAAETVSLVLGGSALLPDYQPDVDDLVARLHVHISRLDRQLMPRWRRRIPALRKAVASARSVQRQVVPRDYLGSRIHLVRLAECVQCLLVWAAADERALAGAAIDRPSDLDRSGVASRWVRLLWGSTSRGVRWGCHR